MKGQDQCYPLFCGALDRGWTHDRLCLLTKWRRFFLATAPLQRTPATAGKLCDSQAFKPARGAGALSNQCDPRHPWLLQEQTHAIDVDDGMTDVQHIHPKNAADDCNALLRYQISQCSCAEFVRKFTAAFPRRVSGKQDRRAMGPRAGQALKMPA